LATHFPPAVCKYHAFPCWRILLRNPLAAMSALLCMQQASHPFLFSGAFLYNWHLTDS
jgi:hypothetical protein